MGNTNNFQNKYSVVVANSKKLENETPIFRNLNYSESLIENFPDENITSAWHLFTRGSKLNNGNNKCLACRKRNDVTGSLDAEYTWITYAEAQQLALTLGTKLLKLPGAVDIINFDDEQYANAKSMRLLGILSKNRVEWFIAEQAANAYNIALVPLYNTFDQMALSYILENTKLTTVIASLECLQSLLDAVKSTNYVKYVIVILDNHEKILSDIKDEYANLGVQLLVWDSFIKDETISLLPVAPGGLDDINTVCFTSGTTGQPKGVLLTHRNLISCIAGIMLGPVKQNFKINSKDITISYLPLAHVLERVVCNALFSMGAAIGVYSGDTLKLLEDSRVLKPTVFVSVPRLYSKINDAVFRGVSQESFIAKYLFNKGINAKLANARSNASTYSRFWDPLVFSKCRKLISNNLRFMISGGAPLDGTIQENVKVIFCTPLLEGYGLSETFGPAFLTDPRDSVAGHVGGPLPCIGNAFLLTISLKTISIEFKLKSVPEMSYYVSDYPPRGELLIRGHTVTVGYFRSTENTNASIDSEGWFHTGDIVVLLPGGSVKIIDRKKNIFKLAQGEYVAPEKIEGVYSQVTLISQIFVFGYSDKTFLVGIVVPDPDQIKIWLKKNKHLQSKSFAELCETDLLKDDIMNEMREIEKKMKLKGYERVKCIHLVSDPFTVENNLLTPTIKIKRHNAKLTYQKIIDSMYMNADNNVDNAKP